MCLTTVPPQSLFLDLWPCSWLLWLTNYSKVSPHKSYTLVQARSPHTSSTPYSPSAACSSREIKERGSFCSWKTNGLHSGLKNLHEMWQLRQEKISLNVKHCLVFSLCKTSHCAVNSHKAFSRTDTCWAPALKICAWYLVPVQCFWPLKCLHVRDWKTRR